LQAWARLLKTHGHDSFKAEKDKRAMYSFFRLNGIPNARLCGDWADNETIINDIRAGTAFNTVQQWPVFLKANHIHGGAGVAGGVKRLMNRSATNLGTKAIISWINSNWQEKSDDKLANAAWRAAGNAITSVVTPGFLLQETAFPGIPVELRVFVLWGRAFAAFRGNGCVYLRGKKASDAETHKGYGMESLLFAHRWMPSMLLDDSCTNDDLVGGCVWSTAEEIARKLALDQVRVDVFAISGDCKVNEISTSSRFPLFSYKRVMGSLWAEPHLKKLYIPFGNAESKPIYLHTAADVPWEAPSFQGRTGSGLAGVGFVIFFIVAIVVMLALSCFLCLKLLLKVLTGRAKDS